jgi:hypothetical protein
MPFSISFYFRTSNKNGPELEIRALRITAGSASPCYGGWGLRKTVVGLYFLLFFAITVRASYENDVAQNPLRGSGCKIAAHCETLCEALPPRPNVVCSWNIMRNATLKSFE